MTAVAYRDFVAAQCLVSISNRAAPPHLDEPRDAPLPAPAEPESSVHLRTMAEPGVTKELHDGPGDAWKDYCTLLTIAKSLLELNKYRPLPSPLYSDSELSSDSSDLTTESGHSCCSSTTPSHTDYGSEQGSARPRPPSPDTPSSPPRPAGSSSEKRHRCPYGGCGKVYGKSSHLKAHYRVHTEIRLGDHEESHSECSSPGEAPSSSLLFFTDIIGYSQERVRAGCVGGKVQPCPLAPAFGRKL